MQIYVVQVDSVDKTKVYLYITYFIAFRFALTPVTMDTGLIAIKICIGKISEVFHLHHFSCVAAINLDMLEFLIPEYHNTALYCYFKQGRFQNTERAGKYCIYNVCTEFLFGGAWVVNVIYLVIELDEDLGS